LGQLLLRYMVVWLWWLYNGNFDGDDDMMMTDI
jgi:hypothetical protein